MKTIRKTEAKWKNAAWKRRFGTQGEKLISLFFLIFFLIFFAQVPQYQRPLNNTTPGLLQTRLLQQVFVMVQLFLLSADREEVKSGTS